MIDARQFVVGWLVNDIYRNKALIKYEIKRLEDRLQRAMGDGKNTRLKPQEAKKYCSELIIGYENLFHLISQSQVSAAEIPFFFPETTLLRCYIKIQKLRQQLALPLTLNDELRIVGELKNY